MNESTDQQLLRDYAERHSDAAFAELVKRHIDLVHSAAFRMTGDPHAAKDVTQGVFVALAQDATRLAYHPVLSGWLHTTARNLAAKTIRTDVRRRQREQEVATMNELLSATPDAAWEEIAPHLDAAMGELTELDRDAVMLRYFEKKSAPEIARVLGVSDEAAQKRVSRAVERLREFFTKRGVSIGAGGLCIVISANAVQAAPAGLSVAISAAALGGTAASTASLATAATKAIAMTTLRKTILGTALVGTIALIAYHLLPHGAPSSSAIGSQLPQSSSQAGLAVGGIATVGSETNVETVPDPVKLLRTVAQARQRIQSGSVEFQYSVDRYDKGHQETNQLRFVALFDGPKLRFESFGREFSYTYDYDEAKQADIVKRADSMSREAAVKAGLLKPFSSHHVLVRDDAVLYDYWQTGDGTLRTDIDDVAKGGRANYIFDPRCVGLTTVPRMSDTVDSYFGTEQVKYIGEESVDGTLAYHVRVGDGDSGATDYWIDKTRPERLIQQAFGLDLTKSRYDAANLDDPIPVEVNATRFINGALFGISRLVRSSAKYNVPVDPASFTLAGLNMEVGTDVLDSRLSRSLGYWTGAGLSSSPPAKKAANSPAPPKQEDMLAWLEYNPSSPEALQCAAWLILNTPDGPMVQKAAEVILQNHTRDTNLVYFCQQLERLRPGCSKPLFEAILKDNPSLEVRGNACFSLATLLKSEAKYGQNKEATAQAVKYYERVIGEFGAVKQRGYSLAELARPELRELRELSIGKPAPNTEGVDLEGQPLKLSSYRGRVVVLVFWWDSFTEVRDYLKLQDKMEGKPFALIGVYGDDASTKHDKYREMVNWPSFRDGRDGPIASLWNVHSWPDVWVLDRHGIIRYRDVRWGDLEDAVNKLLLE